jgi:hypothetical protein
LVRVTFMAARLPQPPTAKLFTRPSCFFALLLLLHEARRRHHAKRRPHPLEKRALNVRRRPLVRAVTRTILSARRRRPAGKIARATPDRIASPKTPPEPSHSLPTPAASSGSTRAQDSALPANASSATAITTA